MLKPILGKPGMFQDQTTKKVINVADLKVLDRTFKMFRELFVQPEPGVSWVVWEWYLLMHPWPEVIPSSLTVEFSVNQLIAAEAPLFSVAKPLARPEDEDLRERLAALEERIEALEGAEKPRVKKPLPPSSFLRGVIIGRDSEIHIRIVGPDTDYEQLHKGLQSFDLQLQGVRKGPVTEKGHIGTEE
jgi:hypothetical protein